MKRSIPKKAVESPPHPAPHPPQVESLKPCQAGLDLNEVLRAIADRPQPTPQVHVQVDVPDREDRPRSFEVEVTERDARGSIKKLIVKEIGYDR